MDNWPLYFRDRLVLGNPDSEISVVTLWTPKEKIVDKLDKNSFALAGQLYSKEGINYIIRNIFANPRICHLIICGEERTGSGRALMNLFEKGVDAENMIIGSEFAQIHREIPNEKIEEFRKNVTFENLAGVFDPGKIQDRINSYKPKNLPWAKPQIFKESRIEFDGTMPTDYSVFKVTGKYAGEVWLEILKKILKFGVVRESFHGNNCRELFNIAATISDEDPDNFRMFPYFQISKKDIENYIPKIMTGVKGTADYTYGERLWNFPKLHGESCKYNQVDEVIVDYLRKYPTDRAACATIFGIQDHTAKSEPCITFLQATVVEEKVFLTVYVRSHDIFGGWLLNAFGLRTLQKYIADKLGRKIGNLTIYSNCAHIYDNNWAAVQKIIAQYGNNLNCIPDPQGYIVLSVEGKEIIAKHISPQGKPLQEFHQDGTEEKATMKLFNKLVLADVVSQISHAFDIGAEIQKAEIAVKKGLKYTQDRELEF